MDIEQIQWDYSQGRRDCSHLKRLEVEITQHVFSGINFSYSDLRQSRLGRTDLSESILQGVNLSEALLNQTAQDLIQVFHRILIPHGPSSHPVI